LIKGAKVAFLFLLELILCESISDYLSENDLYAVKHV